jgi:hypothetical protein
MNWDLTHHPCVFTDVVSAHCRFCARWIDVLFPFHGIVHYLYNSRACCALFGTIKGQRGVYCIVFLHQERCLGLTSEITCRLYLFPGTVKLGRRILFTVSKVDIIKCDLISVRYCKWNSRNVCWQILSRGYISKAYVTNAETWKHSYKYRSSGHYSSSCLLFKRQRFGDSILCGTYSVGPSR